jgi:Peptidase A4 family/FG-GAP-like repeat
LKEARRYVGIVGFVSAAGIGFLVAQLKPSVALAETSSMTYSGFMLGAAQAGFNPSGGVGAVAANWVVPNVEYTTYTAYSGEERIGVWIGIGGTAGDNSLVQIGTASHVESDNSATHFAWYELVQVNGMGTAAAIPLDQTKLGCYHSSLQAYGACPVSPGDVIQANIFCSDCNTNAPSNRFFFYIDNLTEGWFWELSCVPNQPTQSDAGCAPYPSDFSSADWIIEMPTTYELPKYNGPNNGPVVFLEAQAGSGMGPTHFSTQLSLQNEGWFLNNMQYQQLSTPCVPTWVNNSGIYYYNLPVSYGPTCHTVPSAHIIDFDGNGMNDLLLASAAGPRVAIDKNGSSNAQTQAPGSSDWVIWLMSGSQVLQNGALGNVSTDWSVVGRRDFNGDGYADLLWRDSVGDTAIWFLNGTQVASSLSIGNIPAAWSVVGTGDFNGDGFADILWQDNSGNLALWLMNGGSVATSAAIGNVPAPWAVAGIGDFDGDGNSDILWRDTAGDTAIWFMSGTQVSQSQSVGNVPPIWAIFGTRDFNNDGYSDILWQDTSGDTAVWLMSGPEVLSSGGLGNIPTIWSIAATGDYNGDGMCDILWRDTSGDTAIWFMSGTTVMSTAAVGNIPSVWTVQSASE